MNKVMSTIKLLKGDCLQKLKELKANSVDSIVTDPPYGIGFMNKEWDSPKKHKELIEREQKRSEERYKEGKSPAKGGFTKGVQPGLPIGGAKEGKWFEEWSEQWAKEAYRVLKPGGYILSFCAPRMYHRMASGIEDAGFEIRDQIMWVFGSGFPKSHNIGKAVDKIEGNDRELVGPGNSGKDMTGGSYGNQSDKQSMTFDITKGNSVGEGWGTALKPAHEPIVMARKPFKGNVANNVLEWGTGGINVDGCRIGFEDTPNPATNPKYRKEQNYKMPEKGQESNGSVSFTSSKNEYDTSGRFPANIIFECTCDNPKIVDDKYDIRTYNNYKNTFQSYEENDSVKGEYQIKDVQTKAVIHTNPNCPCYILDEQSGKTKSSGGIRKKDTDTQPTSYDINHSKGTSSNAYAGEVGGASRFFYCPKSSKKDRNEGMPEQVPQFTGRPRREDGSVIYKETHPEEWVEVMKGKPRKEKTSLAASEEILQPTTKGTMNTHPTVKPTDLMAYLIRLITPKGGLVLDPFMGSGSTGKAAVREGMSFIGIEREDEYMEIAKSRIDYELKKNKHTEFFDI